MKMMTTMTWNRWLIIGLLCFAGYAFYRAVKAGDDPIEIVYLGAQSWYRDHEVHGYALFFETDEEIDVERMKKAMRILLGDNLYIHESE